METPISNFHTHTYRCGHAEGDISDYVEQAQMEGCSALGFSDHVPLPLDSIDNWQEIRMESEESFYYMSKISESKRKATFPVYSGFECEWSKRYENWYRDFILGEVNVDYLVFGPHWTEYDGEFIYAPQISNLRQLHSYIDTTIEGMQSGLFAFIAHPDIIISAYDEWDTEISACLNEIIDCAISMDLPMEINGQGMLRPTRKTSNGVRYQYPFKEFWLLAQEKGAKIICNSDAHKPVHVLKQAREARKLAQSWGIEIYELEGFTKK